MAANNMVVGVDETWRLSAGWKVCGFKVGIRVAPDTLNHPPLAASFRNSTLMLFKNFGNRAGE